MRFDDCGDMLLFLWMENLLTDGEYDKAIKRFNKRVIEGINERNDKGDKETD